MALGGPAFAQVPGQRIQPPEPIENLQPTTPQTEAPAPRRPQNERITETWQPYERRTPGFQAGAFTLLPAITAGAYYDDNVFATNTNKQHDWVGFVRPELGIATRGSNYAIQAHGFLESRWHDRFSQDDQTNGGAEIGTVVMPNSDTQLVGKLRYLRAHEERGASENLGAVYTQPLGYDVFEASAAINRRFNRWWTSLGVAGSWQEYDDATLVSGGTVSQNYRDGRVSVLSGRVGYVVAPLTSMFVEVSGNERNFEVDAFDSDGYRVVGGVLLEQGPGARVKGEAYVGYMHQDYTGVTFNTVSTYTYGGALAWLMAPGWTATIEGRRVALESALNGGVSVIESVVAGRVDYAIRPNFIVGLGASYIADDFQGANRTDDSLSPLVSVKYLVNPFVTLGFDYRHVNYDTDGIGAVGYTRNVYLFSLNARL